MSRWGRTLVEFCVPQILSPLSFNLSSSNSRAIRRVLGFSFLGFTAQNSPNEVWHSFLLPTTLLVTLSKLTMSFLHCLYRYTDTEIENIMCYNIDIKIPVLFHLSVRGLKSFIRVTNPLYLFAGCFAAYGDPFMVLVHSLEAFHLIPANQLQFHGLECILLLLLQINTSVNMPRPSRLYVRVRICPSSPELPFAVHPTHSKYN